MFYYSEVWAKIVYLMTQLQDAHHGRERPSDLLHRCITFLAVHARFNIEIYQFEIITDRFKRRCINSNKMKCNIWCGYNRVKLINCVLLVWNQRLHFLRSITKFEDSLCLATPYNQRKLLGDVKVNISVIMVIFPFNTMICSRYLLTVRHPQLLICFAYVLKLQCFTSNWCIQ